MRTELTNKMGCNMYYHRSHRYHERKAIEYLVDQITTSIVEKHAQMVANRPRPNELDVREWYIMRMRACETVLKKLQLLLEEYADVRE